jgi:monoamine oxidase
MQVNTNAYLHNTKAFWPPQRFREINADYTGHVAELLAKAVNKQALSEAVSKDDAEVLLASLKSFGALDKDYRYIANATSSDRRGWKKYPGGGLTAVPEPSEPMTLETVLRSGLWTGVAAGMGIEHQSAIFQPVGGMEQVAKGFEPHVSQFIRLNSKVVSIHQDAKGVTATYEDTKTGARGTASADYCLCTIPLSILRRSR